MLLKIGERVHVMHRTFFEKAGNRTLIGIVEACDTGVARIRGHIYSMDPTKMVPVRQLELVTRFVSLVTGEHIVTPLPETVNMETVSYEQTGRELLIRDGSGWKLPLSTLTLH